MEGLFSSKYEEIIQAQLDAIDRQEDEDVFNKELKKMQDELKEKIIINEVIVKDFSARLAKLEEKIYDK